MQLIVARALSFACCQAAGPIGCAAKLACEDCVCGADPWCCEQSWDLQCADRAGESCVQACGCADRCGSPHGDVTGNGSLNVADAICVVLANLWVLSPGAAPPACLAGPAWTADVDCSGQIDVADVLNVVARVLQASSSASGDAACPTACQLSPDDPCAAGLGAPCDDGDRCTIGDVCTAGGCAGTPVSCDDGDPCTVDGCDPAAGCVHQGSGGADGGLGATGASCLDILTTNPGAPSGVYSISPPGHPPFLTYCDMQTHGGGWTYGAIVRSETSVESFTRIPGVSTFGDVSCGSVPSEFSVNLSGVSFSGVRIDNFTRGETVVQSAGSPQVWGGGQTTSGGGLSYQRYSLNASWEFRAGYYAAFCGSGGSAHIPICFTSPSNPVAWACDTDWGPGLGVLDPTGGEVCGGAFYYCKKVWRNASGQCFSYVDSPMSYGFAVR